MMLIAGSPLFAHGRMLHPAPLCALGRSPPPHRSQVMPRGSSIELAREMVDEVDKNRDGKVDYNEVGAPSWATQGPWMVSRMPF